MCTVALTNTVSLAITRKTGGRGEKRWEPDAATIIVHAHFRIYTRYLLRCVDESEQDRWCLCVTDGKKTSKSIETGLTYGLLLGVKCM